MDGMIKCEYCGTGFPDFGPQEEISRLTRELAEARGMERKARDDREHMARLLGARIKELEALRLKVGEWADFADRMGDCPFVEQMLEEARK